MIGDRISPTLIICIFLFNCVSSSFLEAFTNTSTCDKTCEEAFPTVDNRGSWCKNGCKLYTLIALSKGQEESDKILTFCASACSEEYKNASAQKACNAGCKKEATEALTHRDEHQQTLHLLTPLMYIRSAYNTVAHHMRQLITTSWTVYVEEDSGKMVVLQTNPRIVVETPEKNLDSRSHSLNQGSYQRGWQEERPNWMDCISHQSGLPRWLLVVVLFGFILAFLWVCCTTAATAPIQHVASQTKDVKPANDVGYVLLYEQPMNEKKTQLISYEEAPNLPVKDVASENELGYLVLYETTNEEAQQLIDDQAPPLPTKTPLV